MLNQNLISLNCINPSTITPGTPKASWGDLNAHLIDGDRKPIQVPCGKCIPCLQNKRNDWSFRLEQEHKYSKSAYFVTLTYDPKHMPTDMSLDVRHLQLYFKRLRKMMGQQKIRYYAVGEYGSKSGRPHYHILLFNATEEHARTAWRDIKGRPIGLVHIGRVTPASVAYCTKYILQPELKAPEGKKKAFSTMSRAYGIGGKYLTDLMVSWHREDDRNYAMRYNQKVRLPRFYREKIWYHTHDRERISSAAMKLQKKNLELEEKYWKEAHGSNWQIAQAESRNAVMSRIKLKVAFTQHL